MLPDLQNQLKKLDSVGEKRALCASLFGILMVLSAFKTYATGVSTYMCLLNLHQSIPNVPFTVGEAHPAKFLQTALADIVDGNKTTKLVSS